MRLCYTNPNESDSWLRPFSLKMQEGVTIWDVHKRVWRGNVLGGQEWGREGRRSEPAGQHTRGDKAEKRSTETLTLNWWERPRRACVMARGNWQVWQPSLWMWMQWWERQRVKKKHTHWFLWLNVVTSFNDANRFACFQSYFDVSNVETSKRGQNTKPETCCRCIFDSSYRAIKNTRMLQACFFFLKGNYVNMTSFPWV